MKLLAILALIASFFVISACAQTVQQAQPKVQSAEHTIEITSSGYSQPALTVKAGDTVTWVNKDATPHWPASARHPTHQVYPGSDIEKCGTPEQKNIFDACDSLKQGESW